MGVEGIRALCLSVVRGQEVATKTDNLKLSDGQKTRLLSLALEPVERPEELDQDEERGDLLCDILRCPLPVTQHVSGTTKDVPQGPRSIFGPSLGQLLTDPKTDITVLMQIKEYAKALGRQPESDTDKDVFLAVYFAAIASALTFHNEQITQHEQCDLTRFFDHFAQVAWMRTDLRALFVKAAEHRGPKGESETMAGL